MKKIAAYILITIPILNVIGRVIPTTHNRESSISPLSIALLTLMFVGGIILLRKSASKKKE